MAEEVKRIRKRMTPAEFAAVKILLNTTEQTIEQSRLVLVDGKGMAEVGEIYGVSRQAIYLAVGKALAMLKRYREAQFAENLTLQLQKSHARKSKKHNAA